MSLKKNKKNSKVLAKDSQEEPAKKKQEDISKKFENVSKKEAVENLSNEIGMLKEKLDETLDEKLRALAELENIRRRMQKEKEENAKYGAAYIAKDLFPVIDNFDRAILSSPKELAKKEEIAKKYISFHEGVELIHKEIYTILKRHGIEVINPSKGDKFDPNIHQAMLEIPTDKFEPGSVCEILQSGYTIYERLLRPAMVGVSKKIESNKTED